MSAVFTWPPVAKDACIHQEQLLVPFVAYMRNSQRLYLRVSYMDLVQEWKELLPSQLARLQHPDSVPQLGYCTQCSDQCSLQATRDMVSCPICRINRLNILTHHFSVTQAGRCSSCHHGLVRMICNLFAHSGPTCAKAVTLQLSCRHIYNGDSALLPCRFHTQMPTYGKGLYLAQLSLIKLWCRALTHTLQHYWVRL